MSINNSSILIQGEEYNAIFKIYIKYTMTKWGIDPEEVGIILDNRTCYRAKSVVEYWEELGGNLLFISPCWFELAPAEVYFFKLKKEFIKASRAPFFFTWQARH